jgi:hypothetical protein
MVAAVGSDGRIASRFRFARAALAYHPYAWIRCRFGPWNLSDHPCHQLVRVDAFPWLGAQLVVAPRARTDLDHPRRLVVLEPIEGQRRAHDVSDQPLHRSGILRLDHHRVVDRRTPCGATRAATARAPRRSIRVSSGTTGRGAETLSPPRPGPRTRPEPTCRPSATRRGSRARAHADGSSPAHRRSAPPPPSPVGSPRLRPPRASPARCPRPPGRDRLTVHGDEGSNCRNRIEWLRADRATRWQKRPGPTRQTIGNPRGEIVVEAFVLDGAAMNSRRTARTSPCARHRTRRSPVAHAG